MEHALDLMFVIVLLAGEEVDVKSPFVSNYAKMEAHVQLQTHAHVLLAGKDNSVKMLSVLVVVRMVDPVLVLACAHVLKAGGAPDAINLCAQESVSMVDALGLILVPVDLAGLDSGVTKLYAIHRVRVETVKDLMSVCVTLDGKEDYAQTLSATEDA